MNKNTETWEEYRAKEDFKIRELQSRLFWKNMWFGLFVFALMVGALALLSVIPDKTTTQPAEAPISVTTP